MPLAPPIVFVLPVIGHYSSPTCRILGRSPAVADAVLGSREKKLRDAGSKMSSIQIALNSMQPLSREFSCERDHVALAG